MLKIGFSTVYKHSGITEVLKTWSLFSRNHGLNPILKTVNKDLICTISGNLAASKKFLEHDRNILFTYSDFKILWDSEVADTAFWNPWLRTSFLFFHPFPWVHIYSLHERLLAAAVIRKRQSIYWVCMSLPQNKVEFKPTKLSNLLL